MIFVFTTAVMIAMLVHRDKFEWGRPVTFLFWFLYLFLPVNSVIHLYRLRGWEPALALPTHGGWSLVLAAAAFVLGLYGLWLLFAPQSAASFWPWPVDAFQGRV